MGIVQLAHATGECILRRGGEATHSSQMTLGGLVTTVVEPMDIAYTKVLKLAIINPCKMQYYY